MEHMPDAAELLQKSVVYPTAMDTGGQTVRGKKGDEGYCITDLPVLKEYLLLLISSQRER